MEYQTTPNTFRRTDFNALDLPNTVESKLTEIRLETLINLNEEIEREKNLYRNADEKFAANLMKSPISTETAVAYFGAMLGLFPPFAMFSRFVAGMFDRSPSADDFWVIPFLLFVNLIAVVVGFFSGKIVGKLVKDIEKLSWSVMLPAAIFIGIFWGVLTGAASGIFIFLIGAFFGAIIAAIVGAVALPSFVVLHRLFKIGDKIEEKIYFPIALGITGVITAFILGM